MFGSLSARISSNGAEIPKKMCSLLLALQLVLKMYRAHHPLKHQRSQIPLWVLVMPWLKDRFRAILSWQVPILLRVLTLAMRAPQRVPRPKVFCLSMSQRRRVMCRVKGTFLRLALVRICLQRRLRFQAQS